jgi:hypothetical protein
VPSSPIPRASTAPIPAGSFPIPRPAKVESAQPLTASFKPRPSSVPLDDNAEATQADPTPATVPERLPQRTKAPSSVPFLTDTDLPAAPVLDPGLAGMASSPPAPLVSDVVDIPEHVAPDAKPRPTLSFAVERATLSASGISATRERDVKQVAWTDIVGVVARRLPADAPYDGATFVDVVSTAGSTLRVLPWTQLDDELGDAGDGSGEERARALVQLVARRCADAKLDGATRTFLGGRGHAAQLPNADTLAQHDARLA